MFVLENVKDLAEDDMVEIYAQKSMKGKRRTLLNSLNILQFDEDEDLRGSICIDYCLDAIEFATHQGFQWNKVLHVLKFCAELLTETANKGIKLEDAVGIMKEKIANLSTNLKTMETKGVLDYSFNTFFQHYALYIFCMREDRCLDLTTKHSLIELPKEAQSLVNGTDLETWNYKQKMNKIEEEDKQIRNEKAEKLQSKLEALEQKKMEQTENLNEICTSCDGSDFKDILQNLTDLHVKYMESEIQSSLEESRCNVEFALKKGQVTKPEMAKMRPVSKNRSRSKNKNKLAPS